MTRLDYVYFPRIKEDDQLGMLPVPRQRDIYIKRWKAQQERHWTNEIKVTPLLAVDQADWKKIKKSMPVLYELLTNIILFFKCSDYYAGQISAQKILPHCNNVWVASMFLLHSSMETVHNESYSLLADCRFSDPMENAHAEQIALDKPSIRKMINWAEQYVDNGQVVLAEHDPDYLAVLILKFICFEGIFFTGWFAVIYAVKAKGLFPALCGANEYIAQDEWHHVLNSSCLYMGLSRRLSQEKVHGIFKEAVNIAQEFLYDGMSEDIPKINLSRADLAEYIELVCNIILDGLGYESAYPGAKLKLPFVKNKDLFTFASIHESNDSNYRPAISTGIAVNPFDDF
jgi:ribonucleotide reductase beta subunit family protein with ferritin-like domain